LPPVKKRQQNLEYEFKQLKVKASNTGEEGLNKIKEGFPYYNIFDQTMGYRDSVDPDKMEIESSSFMQSASLNADSTSQVISSGSKEREESAAGAARSENEDGPSTSAGHTWTRGVLAQIFLQPHGSAASPWGCKKI